MHTLQKTQFICLPSVTNKHPHTPNFFCIKWSTISNESDEL